MRWVKIAAVAAACVAAPGIAAAAACALPSAVEDLGALRLADRGSACLAKGEQGKAGRLFYAQVIRARALAGIDPDPKGWTASAKAVQDQLGAPVNRWLGGDVDEWMAAIQWALEWDAAAPWSEGRLAAIGHEEQLAASRAASRRALDKLARDLAGLDRERFKKTRQAAGLGYRGAPKN